jgi:hypothetical protein
MHASHAQARRNKGVRSSNRNRSGRGLASSAATNIWKSKHRQVSNSEYSI